MGLKLDWNIHNFKIADMQGTVRCFEPGERLLKDKSGKYIGLLTEGLAKTTLISEEGKERVISFITPLSIFGEVTMLTGRRFISNLSIQSVTHVKVLFITKEDLEEMLKGNPDFAISLLQASTEKVSSLISVLSGSSFQNTIRLIVDVLLSLGSNDGEVHMTHEEISQIIGRNRVTVSKNLLKLQDMGIIEQKKRKIIVKDSSMLQDLLATHS